mmetsp:Transcript_97395/g.252018  ORF Transcript_97395/g.252018 Transcript_97395/m.252018 type:complete len:301 (-) Transcript_97395:842-1744(-)
MHEPVRVPTTVAGISASEVDAEERRHEDRPADVVQWRGPGQAPAVVRAEVLQAGLLVRREALELVELVQDHASPMEHLQHWEVELLDIRRVDYPPFLAPCQQRHACCAREQAPRDLTQHCQRATHEIRGLALLPEVDILVLALGVEHRREDEMVPAVRLPASKLLQAFLVDGREEQAVGADHHVGRLQLRHGDALERCHAGASEDIEGAVVVRAPDPAAFHLGLQRLPVAGELRDLVQPLLQKVRRYQDERGLQRHERLLVPRRLWRVRPGQALIDETDRRRCLAIADLVRQDAAPHREA